MNDLISPIRTRLSDLSQADRKRIADAIGVPFSTVQKIATGETGDPRLATWAALADYFGVACAVPRERVAVPPAPTLGN